MSKSKHKKARSHEHPARQGAGRRFIIAITILAVATIGTTVARLQGERGGFQTLNGCWLRLDGGYILEIRSVDPGGKIDGVYLNPKPINIAKAEATRDGSKLNVFVELRAPNYPGSTYTLTYDSQQDQLQGSYFQAVQRQSFNVRFVRMN